jgi:hypothetical protein
MLVILDLKAFFLPDLSNLESLCRLRLDNKKAEINSMTAL